MIAMSFKSKVNAFGKFYYISVVLLCNDQNRHKVNLPFYFYRANLINFLNISINTLTHTFSLSHTHTQTNFK